MRNTYINFKFYVSRRRRNVHMGLKKALLSYPEHAQILIDTEKFWRRNSNDFELVKPPILIRTVQWKFDYWDSARPPVRVYNGSAGYDLFANEQKIIKLSGRASVRVDLNLTIPEGYYGSIVERSGLANKHCIVAFPGTIDSDYRGVLCVILFNLSDDTYLVERGNRIAQVILQMYCTVHFVECSDAEFDKFCNIERDTGGFGSSLGF